MENRFPDVLSRLMKQRDISDEQLGNAVGVNRTTVTRWRTGIRSPKLDKLPEIAQFFNVSTEYMISGGKSNSDAPKDNQNATLIAAHIDDDVTDSDMKDILDYIEKLKKANRYEKEHGE